jgi:hypothetical protein
MVSLLEGQLKERIAKGFQGKLTLGTLRRVTTTGLDNKGDETSPVTTDVGFEGIRQSFSALYKAQAGIPETDVKILILLGSITTGVTPRESDMIYLKAPWNRWHKVRRILETDPARASCLVQAYEIPTP